MFEGFVDLWQDGWPEKILCILMTIVVLGLLWLALWGLYYLVETVHQPEYTETCVVTYKRFVPTHTTVQNTIISTGKTTTIIPTVIVHPDTWEIHVMFNDGQIKSGNFSKEFYDQIYIEQTLNGSFKKGRISGKKYLTVLGVPE